MDCSGTEINRKIGSKKRSVMLTRLGNKTQLAPEIFSHFPAHKMRIIYFFGAGGDFFTMPKAKYNILNDFDDDVTNLYLIVQNKEMKQILIKEIEILPISSTLVKYWKNNRESDPIKKAVRFLLLSNFTYLGKGDTLRLGLDNSRKQLIKSVEPCFLALHNCQISTLDFRELLSKISFSETVLAKKDALNYLDPIYYESEHTYNVPKWKLKDSLDCLDIAVNSGINTAISEFNHPTIIKEAKKRDLNIINIGSPKRNIKNKKQNILITNYDKPQLEFDY